MASRVEANVTLLFYIACRKIIAALTLLSHPRSERTLTLDGQVEFEYVRT